LYFVNLAVMNVPQNLLLLKLRNKRLNLHCFYCVPSVGQFFPSLIFES
jgi:hypothetical protein